MKVAECGPKDELFSFIADTGEEYHWNATQIVAAFEAGTIEPVANMYLDITEADYIHVSLKNGIEEDHLIHITPERLRVPVVFVEFPEKVPDEGPSHVLIDGNHRLVQTYRNGGRRIAAIIFEFDTVAPFLIEDMQPDMQALIARAVKP